MSHPPPKDDTNPVTKRLREFFDAGGSIAEAIVQFGLTRPSAKHYFIEWKQARNRGGSGQHANQKVEQALSFVGHLQNQREKPLSVVEFFAGEHGFLSRAYTSSGVKLLPLDKRLGTGDSLRYMHRLLGEGAKFDLVDLDPYGFPTRFFPDVFQLVDDGGLLVTMPKPGCNHGNHITWQMLRCYFGDHELGLKEILDRLWWYAMCHWRELGLFNVIDFGRVWRLALTVQRIKATEYLGVRNRPSMPKMAPRFVEPPDWALT